MRNNPTGISRYRFHLAALVVVGILSYVLAIYVSEIVGLAISVIGFGYFGAEILFGILDTWLAKRKGGGDKE